MSVSRAAVAEPDLGLGAPAPARRILFGPLPPSDAVHAVVRRLHAAIALGLLSDGDRLPREADLATQLGVTSFSLREALGVLRAQGLLVTRAGKNGGSFVRHSPESDDLAYDELLGLSSAELRDLGDWRQMLVGHAAALAAARASDSHLTRLVEFTRRVANADSASMARRAHGRFHLELASAAQSMRMCRAEFTLHEEIDWLFGLALRTPGQRSAAAEGLRGLTEAVRTRDPDVARRAAERYSNGLVDQLARLRLEIIATRDQSREGRPGGGRDVGLADQIIDMSRVVVEHLRALAAQAAPLLRVRMTEQERRARVAVEILRVLESFPSLTNGVGVMAEVGVVPDHLYWMNWWLRSASGPIEETGHVMDPSRDDFYDYELREFMDGPRQHRRPWASGPYVDYGGVDDYTITAAVPAVHEGVFVGIAAADILVADLERYLAPGLAACRGTCLLVNAENRVIVSNSVAHPAGEVVETAIDAVRTEIPVFGWTLIVSPTPTPTPGQKGTDAPSMPDLQGNDSSG